MAVIVPLSASASLLWYGDKAGLHQIDSSANRVVLDVAFEPAAALAVNAADGSVWALTQSRLAHLDRNGAVQFQVSLKSLGSGIGAPRLVALNPNDGSAWAGFENSLIHLDSSGALLGRAPAAPADLAVAQDGTLWVLSQSSIEQHDVAGVLVKTAALTGAAKGSKHLALDDTGGGIWIAGDRDLVKLSYNDPGTTLLTLVPPETSSAISVDMQTGDLWFLGQNSVIAFTRDGVPRSSRDLRDFSISNPQSLVYDFASQAAWIGHQQGLSRIAAGGTLVTTFPADAKTVAIAIGRAPLNITPVVSIVAPKDGALVAAPGTPQFRVVYDALCGNASCGFPKSFFSTFTLSAVIDGTQSGSQFQFDPATGGATFTPSSRLPEGPNTWTVQASDAFGHSSAAVSATFTVDTIAPQFQNVTPKNGSAFATSSVTITGNLDDPSASVTFNGQTQGAAFSFPAALVTGFNTLTLTAKDPAGNATTLQLTYLFDLPPAVHITAPKDQDNFTAPASFSITADASDADGSVRQVEFFVNGSSLSVDTTAPYSASVSQLAQGTYTLTAVATDNFGIASTSPPIGVSVGPPNIPPVVKLTSPASGTPYSAPANVHVTATASDADGTISKVDFFRDGALAATATSAPYSATLSGVPAGMHTLTARATDDRGGQTTTPPATITVATTSIVITTPTPNAQIAGTSTLVSGRIVGLANGGVSVNDRVAAVDGAGNFYVTADLSAGSNTITATLTTIDNTTLTASVTVNATGAAIPYAVLPAPSSGLAPLATVFTVVNPTANSASFTFNGSGPFSLPANATLQLSVSFPAGVWVNTVVFSDAAAQYTVQIPVESRDPAQMDQLFRAIWSGMNTALAAGDKDGAMRYLNTTAQKKFGPVFDVLMPFMPGIVGSYSSLATSKITAGIGEYAVTRMDGGVKRVYLIYFTQGADGIWRIDEM